MKWFKTIIQEGSKRIDYKRVEGLVSIKKRSGNISGIIGVRLCLWSSNSYFDKNIKAIKNESNPIIVLKR